MNNNNNNTNNNNNDNKNTFNHPNKIFKKKRAQKIKTRSVNKSLNLNMKS